MLGSIMRRHKLIRRNIFICTIASIMLIPVFLSDVGIPEKEGNVCLLPKTLGTSDLPQTYSSTFSGNTPELDSMVSSFINTTLEHNVVLSNAFKNNSRYGLLSLTNSSFAISGYEIYKVEAKIVNNLTTAAKDWVNVYTTDDTNYYAITKAGTGSNFDMIAQQISQNWRVRMNNITAYTYIGTTSPSLVPAPNLELWNATSNLPKAPLKVPSPICIPPSSNNRRSTFSFKSGF